MSRSQIAVVVSEEFQAQTKGLAKSRGLTVADLIRSLIDAALLEEEVAAQVKTQPTEYLRKFYV